MPNTNAIIKILTKKNKGNMTSIFIGQMFMTVLLIWCLFSFRLTMINSAFTYIDDALTSSLLGGALINVEEYGKSNQMTIYDNDVWDSLDGPYNGWTKTEADILLSKLNYGSDIILHYNNLDNKKEVSKDKRSGQGKYDWSTDYYLRRCVSAFIGNMSYNLSNGKSSGKYSVDNMLSNVSAIGSLNASSKALTFEKSLLEKSFLSTYIVGDIEVTRFDIYNVYRQNLAEKHIYESEFLKGNEDGSVASFVSNFDTWFNNNYNGGRKPDPSQSNYAELMDTYDRKKVLYDIDAAVYNSGQSLMCYTNTQTTYQGKYSETKIPYRYLYISPTSAKVLDTDIKAPVNGYSVYSYKSSNSLYGYSPGTTFKYNDGTPSSINIQGGKMDGAEIENTSLYVELTFTVKTFPGDISSAAASAFENNSDYTYTDSSGNVITVHGTKTVTVARLIDIELKTDN